MKRVLCAVLLFAIVACSNPQNQPIPADLKTAGDDKDFQAAVQKLPQDQRELLAGYMLRSGLAQAFSGGVAKGDAKTVGEAIEQQRKFIADQKAKEDQEKALAAKVAAERAKAVKEMDDAMTVALTGKKLVPKDIYAHRFSDVIEISVAFQNKTTKDITGVKGRLIFKDIFDDKIKSVGLKVDDPIGAGQTYVWNGSMETNQFMKDDTRLAETPQDKLKVVWEPVTYLFKDGSSLKAPEGP